MAFSKPLVNYWHSRPYIQAFRDATPIIAGYFTVASVFGITAVTQGMPIWLPAIMSLFVYAGASQFSFLAMASSGASIFTIVATTFLINLRHLLMAVYMSTWIDKYNIPKFHRWIYAIGLTDEAFAIHSQICEKERVSSQYLICFNIFCHVFWVLGALTGSLATIYADYLVSIEFLDYALTAMMLYVLVSLMNSKAKLGVALISIVSMCILNIFATSYINVFLATAIGCVIGIWIQRRSS